MKWSRGVGVVWTIGIGMGLGSAPEALAAQAASMDGAVHYMIAAEGSEARYRVREQLAGLDFPNDAVGVTSAISGSLVLMNDGTVDSGASRIVIDVTTLTSDQDRRDGYVRRRTLLTEEHPEVVLVPTAIHGLSGAVPVSGSGQLQLVGDLTVMEVTRPTTWDVEVAYGENEVRGTATTTFTFEEFEIQKPSVARVLSVNDDITLEFDFVLQRTDGGER